MISTYIKLIIAYLKIGIFGFGGGYAMLSLIEREIVGSGWITGTMFTDIVAISQMTPGPIGINSATYIGYVVAGNSVIGSIVATIAVVIPSYLLVLYAHNYITNHHDSAVVKGMFMGLRPVVVGLIASAALLLMNKDNFSDFTWSVALCVAAFCVVYFTKIHPIWVIIAAAVAGLVIY